MAAVVVAEEDAGVVEAEDTMVVIRTAGMAAGAAEVNAGKHGHSDTLYSALPRSSSLPPMTLFPHPMHY